MAPKASLAFFKLSHMFYISSIKVGELIFTSPIFVEVLFLNASYMHEWRQTEPDWDKLHLNDAMRAKMGRTVVKFFEGELERKGPLL